MNNFNNDPISSLNSQRLYSMEQAYHPNGYPIQYAPNPAQNYAPQGYQLQQPQQPQPIEVLNGCRVTSVEEVKACRIGLDGSVYLFPNFGQKEIYTKQVDLDGKSVLKVYKEIEEKDAVVVSSVKPSDKVTENDKNRWVSKSDFDKAINSLNSKIGALKNKQKEISNE